jgi:cobalamin biosynthesis protein CobW
MAASLPPCRRPAADTGHRGHRFPRCRQDHLLRGLVQRRQSRRLALLINEFGEVAIDGDLLRAEGDARATCRSRISPMA